MAHFSLTKQPAFLLLAYGLPLLLAATFTLKYSYNLPIWDQWELVPYLEKLQKNEAISFVQLAGQHNEHRLLFPKIIMLALAQLTSWNVNYEVLVGFIFFFLTSLFLFYSLVNLFSSLYSVRQYKIGVLISCLVSAILYFSLCQSQNLLWGWQLQIFLDVMCLVAGMFYLTQGHAVQWKQVIVSLLLGIIATFSFANGLTYWLVGGLILALRARDTKHITWKMALWVSVASIVAILYFHDFKHPANEPSVFYVFYHPIKFLLFFLSCLGAPITRFGIAARVPSYLAGAIGFAAIFAGMRYLLINKLFFNKRFIFWHSLLFYSLVSCALISIGRVGGSIGLDLAGESRYITISVFFWLWLSVVGIWILTQGNRLKPILYGPVLVIFLVFFTYYTRACIIDAGNMYQKKHRLSHELENNNFLAADMEVIYPNASDVASKNTFLKKNNLSFHHKQK